MKLGFIGTGIMGGAMATRLLEAGHTLLIHTRTKAKAERLIAQGALWCGTAEETTAASMVFTMLGVPADVEDIYLNHLLPAATPGTILVDFTTSSPLLAEKIAAARSDVPVLDAPVTGGDIGAKSGTLSILVGGNERTFQDVYPILSFLAKTITYFGPAGSGQHAKLANQIALAGTVQGVTEALAYARTKGLSLEKLIAALGGGAAGGWQFANLGPKIAAGDFTPGFMIRHFLKDIDLALAEAEKSGIRLPVLEEAKLRYSRLDRPDQGTQSLIQEYEKK